MSNNIVTTTSALIDENNYNIIDNNLVCFDMTQGFIGVHKSSPEYEIDISGTLKCSALRINYELFNIAELVELPNFIYSIIPQTTNTCSLGSNSKIWSNAYIRNLSVNAIDVSNLNPLTNNAGSLGDSNKVWRNAYLRDLSVGSVDVSVNINPLTNNNLSLGRSDKVWSNAYLRDISVGSIDASININPFFNSGSLGAPNKLWRNAYIHDLSVSSIDVSANVGPLNNLGGSLGGPNQFFGNAYIRDLSIGTIDVCENVVPLTNLSGSLGASNKLWRNAFIRDLSMSFIDVSVNLNPLLNNSASLGGPNKIWNNAYMKDLSASVISISGNIIPIFNISGSLGGPSKLWGNAYLHTISASSIDVSVNLNPLVNNSGSLGASTKLWRNAYINDLSVANISVSGNIIPFLNLSGGLGGPSKLWGNAYIRDLSASTIDVSVNLNPLINNGGSVGASNKIWGNAYLRDVSVSNAISISGNIIPVLNVNSNLGSSANRWRTIFIDDLSTNKINGLTYSGGSSTVISSISNNIIPSTTNTYNLGSSSIYWKNAYITDMGVANKFDVSENFIFTICGGSIQNVSKLISDVSNNITITTNRIYQQLKLDISWNAVNGYYGLAKDAYPALNPYSSGDLAVKTWTSRVSPLPYLAGCCWSPELGLFVCVQNELNGGIIISPNGIDWTLAQTYPSSTRWSYICWSPQLKLFVATATAAPDGRTIATSTNGNIWTLVPISTQIPYYISDICWSAELGMFVVVAEQGGLATSINGYDWIRRGSSNPEFGYICWSAELNIFVATEYYGNVMRISKNGIDWIAITINTLDVNTWIQKICWSSNLGIFVIVSRYGPHRVATSIDGINWKPRTQGVELLAWCSVCWSPQLILFIAISEEGSIMTSPNGIIWKLYLSGLPRADICWSPELGIFVVVGGFGTYSVMTSSLKGRPPTSYNVFDSSFNRIDEAGAWNFLDLNAITLTANGAVVNSDDRLKHNEININNGLDIISLLVPKFYQKTHVLLDASYNSNLNGYIWNYEAGLIAQELLQISDVSFVVGGGDYYEQTYKLIAQTNDASANYYEVSANHYDTSANRYDTSASQYEVINNLIIKPYNVNYNSVFTYGLAAIKELHKIFKTQETTILNQKSIINSLISRVEALENKP